MPNKFKIGSFLGLLLAFSFAYAGLFGPTVYPQRTSLVDTGYDLCIQTGGKEADCSQNKNLLFRGSLTFPHGADFTNRDDFYQKLFTYLQNFKAKAKTNAALPQTLAELKNYRVVIINLMAGTPSNQEHDAPFVIAEYNASGAAPKNNTQLPLQHYLYGDERPFSTNHYDFQWWPITYYYWKVKPFYNAPNTTEQGKTIPGTFPPVEFKSQDLAYLVTGISTTGDAEKNAANLKGLLLAKLKDSKHPLLIYYHCAAGKDRTGLVTMGYFMNNGGFANIDLNNATVEKRQSPMSYRQALKATTQGGYPTPHSLKVAKEYCHSLPGKDCH